MEGLLKYIFIHIIAIACVFYVLKLREDIDQLQSEFNDFKRNYFDHFHCRDDGKVITGPPGVYSESSERMCLPRFPGIEKIK